MRKRMKQWMRKLMTQRMRKLMTQRMRKRMTQRTDGERPDDVQPDSTVLLVLPENESSNIQNQIVQLQKPNVL